MVVGNTNTDWEGPWVTADHAHDVTAKGCPNGDRLFAGVSEYDDWLSYIVKKPGYEPGDTLALIAPFLISYGVDDKFLRDVAKEDANFIDGSLKALRMLHILGYEPKVISTSYSQYVHEVTAMAGIPTRNTRSTYFPIDEYASRVTEEDKKFVREKAADIVNLPKLNISSTSTINDLTGEVQEAARRLDEFFWEELPKTSFSEVLEKVKPVGGERKYHALRSFLEEEGRELHESVTIGDSITDFKMLRKTKEAGGLAVSFNGNDYAIRDCNIAEISTNCMTTVVIVDAFRRRGIETVQQIAENWDHETLKKASQEGKINTYALRSFEEAFANGKPFPKVVWVTDENIEATIKESKAMRKSVRGVKIGSLG